MTCKHEQDCKGYTPETTGKSKHKRGERFTDRPGNHFPIRVPDGHHIEYAGEVRMPRRGEHCDGGEGWGYTADVDNFTSSPSEILLLVPDGPLVKVDWWDKDAVKHSYQFYGEVDWPRIKRECFDEDGAEVVMVAPIGVQGIKCGQHECKADGAALMIMRYEIDKRGWTINAEGFDNFFGYWVSQKNKNLLIADSDIISAIRKHNKPAVPEWWKEKWYAWRKPSNRPNMGLLLPIKHAEHFDGYRPASLDDLSVEIAGKTLWFVEESGGLRMAFSDSPGIDTIAFADVLRDIAVQYNAPIIPQDQWDWLQARKEGK